MMRVALIAVLGMMAVGAAPTEVRAVSLTSEDRVLLATYARDTWRSLDAMSATGQLPVDGLWRAGESWTAANYTSPTNIAAYLWSTIVAERLGLITREDSGRRLGGVLAKLGHLERSHGFFYNWYDPRTGDRLRVWPGGGPVRGFLSTVDNGWLAAALMMVGQARAELKNTADAILVPMNFGFFYDPHDPSRPAIHPGLLRGGYFTDGGGEYTDFHYGVLNTEPRIASYIGIARGDLPADHYYRMVRSAPNAASPSRSYRGVLVSEGALPYRGSRVVPSWDGSMFEALMVPLFVPEAAWGPESWGVNHRLYARAQIDYGLNDARLGFWGVSASSDSRGGYRPFGIAPLGLAPNAGREPDGTPTRVITPHASFLAMPFVPREAMDNLKALAAAYPVYSHYGFLDAVDVGTGHVSEGVLVLDQGMILAAIANVLGMDVLIRSFSTGIEASIRPLLAAEQFEVSPRPSPRNNVDLKIARVSTVTLGPVARPAVVSVAEGPVPPPARPWRRVLVVQAARPAGPVAFGGGDERTDALGPRRTPLRRRGGKASERRRAVG